MAGISIYVSKGRIQSNNSTSKNLRLVERGEERLGSLYERQVASWAPFDQRDQLFQSIAAWLDILL
jgi:hypothetical protein